MIPSEDFHRLGKSGKQKVPEGFFESIAEKTLALAKKRENSARQKKILLVSLSAAASVAVMLFFGLPKESDQHTNSVVQVGIDSLQKPTYQDIPVENKAMLVLKESPISIAKDVKQEKKASKPNAEDLNQLLAQLSDDELQLMAAMIQSDPINIEETETPKIELQ